jgi:alkanesulfonate monooxygenase SsuD/methylene tetrahydromethanopterin reductase-like flavin-dependent oxidoreductase (luciferase family)
VDALHLPQDPELVARYPTLVESLEAHGYGGMWVGEVNGSDAASAAAVAATRTTVNR